VTGHPKPVTGQPDLVRKQPVPEQPVPEQPVEPVPLLVLEQLALTDRRGTVFGPVSFALDPGALGVVHGPSGSGRSSLLLAAAGRMSGLTGSGRLGSFDLVKQAAAVRQRTAVARIAQLVDLELQLTVEESIVERSLTEGVSSRTAEAAVAAFEALLGCVFPRAVLVADLSRLDQGRLALALAGVRPADLVVLDDVDHDLDPADQRRLFAALAAVAATGPAVLASTIDTEPVPDHAVVVSLTVQEI
jgi:ABC-2 type transport system ATP-binding protein